MNRYTSPELGTCEVGTHRSPAAEAHREPHPYDWRTCIRWLPVDPERDESQEGSA